MNRSSRRPTPRSSITTATTAGQPGRPANRSLPPQPRRDTLLVRQTEKTPDRPARDLLVVQRPPRRRQTGRSTRFLVALDGTPVGSSRLSAVQLGALWFRLGRLLDGARHKLDCGAPMKSIAIAILMVLGYAAIWFGTLAVAAAIIKWIFHA